MVAGCLLGGILLLLVIGLVSNTTARHLAQVAPALLVLGVGRWNRDAAAWMALPVFVVWIVVMAAIWLQMFGLSSIAEGTYSPPEVILTIAVAACSAVGIWKSISVGRGIPLRTRMVALIIGMALQTAFMAMSLQLFD